MARARALTGKSVPIDQLDCEPLHGFVGYDLCAQFMVMFDVRLSNGHTARVFKHRWTRCYLHLDRTEPGLAYQYRGNGRYRLIDLSVALRATFRFWESESDEDRERDWMLLNMVLDRLDRLSAQPRTTDEPFDV